jgi:hypothetical protein
MVVVAFLPAQATSTGEAPFLLTQSIVVVAGVSQRMIVVHFPVASTIQGFGEIDRNEFVEVADGGAGGVMVDTTVNGNDALVCEPLCSVRV